MNVLGNCPVRSNCMWHAIACHAMPCHAMPCHAHAMPCHGMACHGMPCHAMPCHAMPFHAMVCHGMPWHGIPWRAVGFEGCSWAWCRITRPITVVLPRVVREHKCDRTGDHAPTPWTHLESNGMEWHAVACRMQLDRTGQLPNSLNNEHWCPQCTSIPGAIRSYSGIPPNISSISEAVWIRHGCNIKGFVCIARSRHHVLYPSIDSILPIARYGGDILLGGSAHQTPRNQSALRPP